ncbi:hypothetical protein BJX64DRAFT_10879 [Aspergillus heterothallicus]
MSIVGFLGCRASTWGCLPISCLHEAYTTAPSVPYPENTIGHGLSSTSHYSKNPWVIPFASTQSWTLYQGGYYRERGLLPAGSVQQHRLSQGSTSGFASAVTRVKKVVHPFSGARKSSASRSFLVLVCLIILSHTTSCKFSNTRRPVWYPKLLQQPKCQYLVEAHCSCLQWA